MKAFLLALQFLTVIPLKFKQVDGKRIARSMVYFPAVGLLVGLLLAGINRALLFLGFNGFSVNVVLVVALIVLTGGMHLDGLADAADAFLSGKDKQEMLRIMRDSRIGVMGVLSLVSAILLKIALLLALSVKVRAAALLLMCLISRWGMVALLFLFPYARNEGKAKAYSEGSTPWIFLGATFITLVCAGIIWQWKAAVPLAAVTLLCCFFGRYAHRKVGGITGDVAGAQNELAEIMVLFAIVVMERMGAWIR